MRKEVLTAEILKKGSFLCVGLDTDPEKIPAFLQNEDDPVFEFNKQIIEATHDLCVSYKINTAFYEASGVKGWKSLEKTIQYLNVHHPDVFTIADAKRGDIGNTSKRYAAAFFKQLNFHSITVAPYMGSDSVMPFRSFESKWVILLALTSNEGASDFQFLELNQLGEHGPEYLFQQVLETSKQWGDAGNTMYVVGATKAAMLQKIRRQVPDHFLLVPGVGAQGGSLEEVAENGLNAHCGILVNASRSIIYASSGEDFATAARQQAHDLQKQMHLLLKKYGVSKN